MKQVDLARTLNISQQWFCAVLNGRADAGKELALKASEIIGGTIDIWMLKRRRAARRPLVAKYMDALRKAHRGN